MLRLASVLVAVVASASMAGCGGDDGDDRLSKAALIDAGDAACQQAIDDTAPLFGELFPTGSELPPASAAAGPMGRAASILRHEHDVLAALRAPEEDEDEYEAILDGLDEAVREVETSASLAADGDTEGYLQALERANQLDATSRELFADYGFTTCAGE